MSWKALGIFLSGSFSTVIGGMATLQVAPPSISLSASLAVMLAGAVPTAIATALIDHPKFSPSSDTERDDA